MLYTAAILLIGDVPYELNGTSPPIHEANFNAPIKLDSVAKAVAYLHFFCCYVAGDRGHFRIVEHAEDLPWEPSVGQEERDAALRALRPLAMWKEHDTDDEWHATASVLYGNAIFHAKFKLQPKGMVEMEDDRPIAVDLAIKPIRFTGNGPPRSIAGDL